MTPTMRDFVVPFVALLMLLSGVTCACDVPDLAVSTPHAHHGMDVEASCIEVDCCVESCTDRFAGLDVQPGASLTVLRSEDPARSDHEVVDLDGPQRYSTGPPPLVGPVLLVASTPVQRHDLSLD